MKQQLREKIWKKTDCHGEIPKISKEKRVVGLLRKALSGESAFFSETVPEKIKKNFDSVEFERAEVVVSGAVAASDSGACIALGEKEFKKKKVIAVVDSSQLIETDLYDFTADMIVTPHYIIPAKKVMGIDEAGRGCVIGPLVVGAVAVKKCQLGLLKKIGAVDSKTISSSKREKISQKLHQFAEIGIKFISPAEIDGRNGSCKNLNRLEEEAFIYLIKKIDAKRVFTDALGSDCERFSRKLELSLDPSFSVTSAIRGDSKFPVVGAASIIAKSARDMAISELHERYGDFGSGYCHDLKTKNFLSSFYEKNRFFPPIVRHNWSTIERIKGELTQTTLY